MDKIFKLPIDTEIDGKLVSLLINKHNELIKFYEKMDSYYKGKHDIVAPNNSEYNKTIEVISNRTKYIVDIYNGYFLGSPIKLKCEDDNLLDELEAVDKVNQANQVNRVISKNMAKYGHAFDLVFYDDQANVTTRRLFMYMITPFWSARCSLFTIQKLKILSVTGIT